MILLWNDLLDTPEFSFARLFKSQNTNPPGDLMGSVTIGWVTNVIVAVHYSKERKHIESVKIMKYTGSSLVPDKVYLREGIIRAIKQKTPIITATQEAGVWKIGAEVIIAVINGVEYLK